MINPYLDLPQRAFWKPAVASRNLFDLDDVWRSKFDLQNTDRFVTFGSCFAQHIGRALAARGFDWFNAEPGPRGLSPESLKRFNYNIFSARTANIYTTSLLRQWVGWATGEVSQPTEAWEQDGRFYDPFRPTIEPGGFASREEMRASRDLTVDAFRACITEANYFVFTLGLTESWVNAKTGDEYPMCPGTTAGVFNRKLHRFINHEFVGAVQNLEQAMEGMKTLNPSIRFVLTVSPVPLTATQSGNHVMVATMESKSILRAVAGQLARTRADTDYFPSYELINSPVTKAIFFEPNQRDVNPHGVNFVMDNFFKGLEGGLLHGKRIKSPKSPKSPKSITPSPTKSSESIQKDIVCEEELLAAFGEKA